VSGTATYRGAPQRAIQHHYDLSNEFYALWLDSSRTYSCALWEDGDTLERAQERKLDYHAEHAGAIGAGRVLDVGCGWGSLMRRLVDRHGVRQVVGLTLSEAQAEWISTWADERFESRVENWADHRPSGPYDAIVSIGAFEHFADYGLPKDARVAAYREFFTRCHEWLVPAGRISLQTIAKGSNVRLDRQGLEDMRFVIEQIFPNSELPWLAEIAEASSRRFEVVTLRNDAHHYARTLREWHERLTRSRARATELVGPEVTERYERYLLAAERGMRNRHLGLLRIELQRV
jgi:cyclopropane-fatty-acyl-phospholipid synthase